MLHRTSLVLLLSAPLWAGDVTLKNDGLDEGSTVAVQAGLVNGETAAAVLAADPSQYPLRLNEVSVFIGKHSLVPGNTMTVQIVVWDTSTISGNQPTLASAIYTSPNIVFTQGFFNVVDISASNVVVNGNFILGCKVVSTGSFLGLHSPNPVTDTNGCQNGKNWVRPAAPAGAWINLCGLGASGDWAIRTNATVLATGDFIDLGLGLAGDFAPALSGSGSLAADQEFTLDLVDLPPGTTGFLFVGLTAINAPFKGGTLVPATDLIIELGTGAGSLSLPASLPPGVPEGTSIYLQGWFPDDGAPKNADATNGLELQTP